MELLTTIKAENLKEYRYAGAIIAGLHPDQAEAILQNGSLLTGEQILQINEVVAPLSDASLSEAKPQAEPEAKNNVELSAPPEPTLEAATEPEKKERKTRKTKDASEEKLQEAPKVEPPTPPETEKAPEKAAAAQSAVDAASSIDELLGIGTEPAKQPEPPKEITLTLVKEAISKAANQPFFKGKVIREIFNELGDKKSSDYGSFNGIPKEKYQELYEKLLDLVK